MQRLPIGPLVYEFSRHLASRLEVEPGETFQVETEDAFSGQIRSDSDRRDKSKVPYSNPLSGPIWIRGAEPGDSLAIDLIAIEPLIGQCATRTGQAGLLGQWLGGDCPHGCHVCPIHGGEIHWGHGITIPYQPMLGCIGVAPAMGSPGTLPAGDYGGNMDIVETAPGSTVYLPVCAPGGLLYLGDAHAAMGHGELSASGLEMPALTTLSVRLLKGRAIASPRIETPGELIAIASGSPMELSTAQAYSRLILWLEQDYGFDRWLAYDLLTHVGRLSVGYFGIGTVAAKIEKRYLRGRLT